MPNLWRLWLSRRSVTTIHIILSKTLCSQWERCKFPALASGNLVEGALMMQGVPPLNVINFNMCEGNFYDAANQPW